MAFELIFHDCSIDFSRSIGAFCTAWSNLLAEIEVKTSGSTGVPKTIYHKREQMIASALRTNTFFGLGEKSSVLCTLDAQTIGGKMVLIRAMVGNYTVHVVSPRKNPFDCLDPRLRFDFVSLVPLQIKSILAENPDRLKHVHTILLGGSALNKQDEIVIQAAHTNCYMGFGMTETISHIALRKLGTDFYSCLNGLTLETRNDQLIVSDSILHIEQLQTTDLVELIDNKHFKWLGRNDFTINTGGVKIQPEPIEAFLSEKTNKRLIIIGLPDEKYGEIVSLISESDLGATTFKSLNKQIAEEFGKYAVPKQYIVHSIPYSVTMKPLRKLLREQLLALK